MTLDLTFTDEQEMLRETVRGTCAAHAPLEVVRALEDDPVGFTPELWKKLGELDLIGLLIPEEHGGSGMSTLEGCVLYEELGRSLAPTPHFVSAVMAAGVVAAGGTEEQKARWLPGIASGERVFSTAWLEPGGGYEPAGIQTAAIERDGGFVLTGTKWHVPFASSADWLVVVARTGPADAIDLFVVDPGAEGVTMDQQLTIACDAQYAVHLDEVPVGEAERIGAAGSGWHTWNRVLLDGAILQAAFAMGGAQQALELAVQYAKDRQQFDKPLGAFQAIAHYLADARTAVDGGTTLVHEAAWAAAAGRDVSMLAPMAKLFACQTFRDVTATAQQIFGGVGFTLEYDIQLYFRRAKALQLNWWDDRELEERVAAAVLD